MQLRSFAGRTVRFELMGPWDDTSLEDVAVRVQLDDSDEGPLEDYWSPLFVAAFLRDGAALERLAAAYAADQLARIDSTATSAHRLGALIVFPLASQCDEWPCVFSLQPVIPLLTAGDGDHHHHDASSGAASASPVGGAVAPPSVEDDVAWFVDSFIAKLPPQANVLISAEKFATLRRVVQQAPNVCVFLMDDARPVQVELKAATLWTVAHAAASRRSASPAAASSEGASTRTILPTWAAAAKAVWSFDGATTVVPSPSRAPIDDELAAALNGATDSLNFFLALTGPRDEAAMGAGFTLASAAARLKVVASVCLQRSATCPLFAIPDTHAAATRDNSILLDDDTVFKGEFALVSVARAMRQQTAAWPAMLGPWREFFEAIAARFEPLRRIAAAAATGDACDEGHDDLREDAGNLCIVLDALLKYVRGEESLPTAMMSSADDALDFESAQHWFASNARRFSDAVKLEMYALFKQATAGDVSGSRPWLVDVRGRAKYDAWANLKGTPNAAAEAQYVERCRSMMQPT